MQKIQDGYRSLANCVIFEIIGVTDAFSLVSYPIQSPICSSSKFIFATLTIPKTKIKMASNMAAKSSINLISVAIQG